MRICFVSNMFPPLAWGGYEQWCEEVALALYSRGHQVAVLTAKASTAAESDAARYPFAVHRLLNLEVEGGLGDTVMRLLRDWPALETANARQVDDLLATYQPDVVFVWGMWNVPRSVPQRIEQVMGKRVVYYFCDYWPSLPSAFVQRLEEPARHQLLHNGKAALRRFLLPSLAAATPAPLELQNPICVSRAVRDLLVARGVAVAHAQVIYGGTHLSDPPVPIAARAVRSDNTLRLLYLGRLEQIKGVHTVLEAMAQLGQESRAHLDVYGAGHPDYVALLHTLIAERQLGEVVEIKGTVPRREVRAVMAAHDALVFSSEWEEPFARTLLEAMAAGLAVVGTTTGGTGELLVDGKTGLTYAAGDAAGLATQIERMAADPGLCADLAGRGQRRVYEYFTIDRMVDEMEAALTRVADGVVV